MNILIFISCMCIIFIFGRLLIMPIKWILKLILNSIFGAILIFGINFIGGVLGLHIGLNFYTAILVGILGIPGAVFLIIIQLFLI